MYKVQQLLRVVLPKRAVFNRVYHTTSRCCRREEGEADLRPNEVPEHPAEYLRRVWKEELRDYEGQILNKLEADRAKLKKCPEECDILIIGGGAIGSALAFFLKYKTVEEGLSVVVVEKDSTYSQSAMLMDVGAMRQEFSLPENIQLSLYGTEFMRKIKKYCGEHANIQYIPCGYLVLANEENANTMVADSVLQNEMGVVNKLLSRKQLEQRFPFMTFNQVELGCLGVEKHGWFDVWSLFSLIRSKGEFLGAQFLDGEVIDFHFETKQDIVVDGCNFGTYQGTNEVLVRLANGDEKYITFGVCVIAAGHNTPNVGRLLRIGGGEGLLSVRIPIETRKRYVYQFLCRDDPPGVEIPMIYDHSGIYCRRDGLAGHFLAGVSPPPDEEVPLNCADNNYQHFYEKVLPPLIQRVPGFKDAVPVSYWSGLYDYNYFDGNGIIGPHPYYMNIYVLSGFTGHGIQHAPAIGKAASEMLLEKNFASFDLFRLGFDRFIADKPMYEIGVY